MPLLATTPAEVHAFWRHLYVLPWIVIGLWWLVRALSTERTEQKESILSRLSYLLLSVAGGVLLAGAVPVDLLAVRLWPRSLALALIGLVLEWAGVLFAIWARESLGRLWSGTVTLKEGHQVVKAGPYRFVRHPIYTGILTALLGVVVARADPAAFLGLALIVAGILRKIAIEEKLLEGRFGEEYRVYRKEVRALIPFLLALFLLGCAHKVELPSEHEKLVSCAPLLSADELECLAGPLPGSFRAFPLHPSTFCYLTVGSALQLTLLHLPEFRDWTGPDIVRSIQDRTLALYLEKGWVVQVMARSPYQPVAQRIARCVADRVNGKAVALCPP